MRVGLILVALAACREPVGPGPADDHDRREPGHPPIKARPPRGDETPAPDAGIRATGLTAAAYPLNALGRSLTVTLSGEAPAVVTCALEAAPPLWRQLLPLDATWRWQAAVDPGPAFSEPAFDDTSWESGPGPFGQASAAATLLAPVGLDAPARAWFRATFEVADPAAVRSLEAAVRRDDGVVLWLNGVEVVRDNVPVLLRVDADLERTLFPFDLDPALLVAGTNTVAAELHQDGGSSDAGFALRLSAEVDELLPETHVLRSEEPATTHTLSLFGLLPDATYACEARADGVEGPAATAVVRTDPLPLEIRLAAAPGMDLRPHYTLFNHSRPCGGDRSNRLFVVDPEGRVRWTRELPIDAPSSIDIESRLLDDGTILWGGGDEPEGAPQILGLDGEVVYSPSYPGAADDVYHHDVEQLPNGRLLGLVDSRAGDGVDSWSGFALVEHDPATGEVTWRWESQQGFDLGQLAAGDPDESDPWHPNSLARVVDDDGEGVYVSLFDTREIVRIDRDTEDVTWHLGLGGDFTLTDGGVWFDHLHAVDVVAGPTGPRVYLYDNGDTRGQSRAMALDLDIPARTATIAWEWTEPTWYESNWGDADPTGEGTVLVTMSHAWCLDASLDHLGAFVEVEEATGDVLSRLDFLDQDESTYRGQRIDGCELFSNDRYCADGG